MAYSAIIADDEQELRTYLRTLLSEVWPDLVICGEAANGQEAVALVEATQPQIAFLDIKMPGLSGMEVAKKIAGVCRIVFVTAFDQYAVEAFEGRPWITCSSRCRRRGSPTPSPASRSRWHLRRTPLRGWPRWSNRSSPDSPAGRRRRSSDGSGPSRRRTSASSRWRR